MWPFVTKKLSSAATLEAMLGRANLGKFPAERIVLVSACNALGTKTVHCAADLDVSRDQSADTNELVVFLRVFIEDASDVRRRECGRHRPCSGASKRSRK